MPKTILVCVKNCGQRVAFQFDDHWPECHGMPMVREEDPDPLKRLPKKIGSKEDR